MILSLETSTTNCSVALHNLHGELIDAREQKGQNIHASRLFIFIESILVENHFSYHDLKAVAVSKGPGSYTGLRIGVSAAKGLCYSLDLPLISVNTLALMAKAAVEKVNDKNGNYIPMIDARRMEVYNAVYDYSLAEIRGPQATIVESGSFSNFTGRACFFFGEGMPKCRELLSTGPSVHFIEGIDPSARMLGAMAIQKYHGNEFENTAYFEPYYLKEFVSQSTFHRK